MSTAPSTPQQDPPSPLEVVAAALEAGDDAKVNSRLGKLAGGADPAVRGAALLCRGFLADAGGDRNRALADVTAALHAWREVPAADLRHLLGGTARLLTAAGASEQAARFLDTAEKLCLPPQDAIPMALIAVQRGEIAAAAGDLAAAEQHWRRAVDIAGAEGGEVTAVAIANVARLALDRGELDFAEQLVDEVLKIQNSGAAAGGSALLLLELAARRPDRAEALVATALRLPVTGPDRRELLIAASSRAHGAGDHAAAMRFAIDATRASREAPPDLLAGLLHDAASLAVTAGQPDQARDLLERAVAVAPAADAELSARIRLALAAVQRDAGEPAVALATLRDAAAATAEGTVLERLAAEAAAAGELAGRLHDWETAAHAYASAAAWRGGQQAPAG